MTKKTYLIFGISKGLGKAITQAVPGDEDLVYGISRSKPDYLENHKNNYTGSLRLIPLKTRKLFVHSYQSYLYNKIVK